MNSDQDSDFYSKKLFADKLRQAYEIAGPRIQQHLTAEIDYVLNHVNPTDAILDVGCGYGRVLAKLATKAKRVVGVDISKSNLDYAKSYLIDYNNIELYFQTARNLQFDNGTFDIAIAIQNPISAFKIDPKILVTEMLKVVKKGGIVLISSYSDKIWEERLQWFEEQSHAGLLGEIDKKRTTRGTIVFEDGFSTSTFSENDFNKLIKNLGLSATIEEVDNSVVFCKINK